MQRIEKASGEFTRRRLSLWFRGYYFNIKFIAHFIAHIIAHLSLIFMPYIAIHTAKTNSNLNTPKIYIFRGCSNLYVLNFTASVVPSTLHYSCRMKNSSLIFFLSLLRATKTLLSGIFARFTHAPMLVSLLSVKSL